MTLLLVRHGETDALGRLLAGRQPGWPLNSAGDLQVTSLAGRIADLGVNVIYSSPLERCLQTADLLSQPLGLTVVVRAGLAEVDFGEWEGRTFESLNEETGWRDFNRIRTTTCPPGGERMIEVQSRMIREIDQMRASHRDQTVMVVSHGDPIRLTVAYYLGIPIDFVQRFKVATASVTAIQFTADQPLLLFLNRAYEN